MILKADRNTEHPHVTSISWNIVNTLKPLPGEIPELEEEQTDSKYVENVRNQKWRGGSRQVCGITHTNRLLFVFLSIKRKKENQNPTKIKIREIFGSHLCVAPIRIRFIRFFFHRGVCVWYFMGEKRLIRPQVSV